MTIVLVDDQRSILDGLLSGVPFNQIGFETVLTAGDTQEALEQLAGHSADVLMTDIEMPGENGMELIRRAKAKYPDLLCIPLTSHADFAFAKESVRLGCFDYLVQPVPYEDVAACLQRAFDARVRQAQQKYAQNLGSIVQESEPGVTGHMVMKLYSSDPGEVAEALQYLAACGYEVSRNTPVRMCIVEDRVYKRRAPERRTESEIITMIRDSFSLAEGHPVPLTTRNPYRQFVVMLCHPDGVSHPPCSEETFKQALAELTQRLVNEPTVYIGPETTVASARGELPDIHQHIDNNVSEQSGLIRAYSTETRFGASSGRADMLPRWQNLLNHEKYDILAREIQAYLDRIQRNKPSLRSLADLHQQLTQMLFEHLKARKMDIMGLFTPEYTYTMYMDSCKTVSAFREGIRFLLDAAARQQQNDREQNDVERAKAYIYAHLDQPMYVTDVANHVSLSSEYFTKLFKKETGQNIKDFITQAKINTAKQLLAHSDIPVSLVAMELGYDNFSHFTQIFKKMCSMTPSDYRKEQKEGNG